MIRLIDMGDVAAFYDLIHRNRKYLQQDFPVTVESISDMNSATRFVSDRVNDMNQKTGFYFLIAEESVIIGIISGKNIDWRTPKAEIAYFVDKNRQGKGVITLAIAEVIDYCFNELLLFKLYACINVNNTGSKKVVLKNGFKKEGVLRKNFRDGFENLNDSEYYGLLKIGN